MSVENYDAAISKGDIVITYNHGRGNEQWEVVKVIHDVHINARIVIVVPSL